MAVRYEPMSIGPLRFLTPGQLVPFGGDRVAMVSDELAEAFREGDRLVVVQETGDLLLIPRDDHERVRAAVGAALAAFHELSACTDDQLTHFFGAFADRLADDEVFADIAAANDADVAAARERGRSTTRLVLSPTMRRHGGRAARWQHADGRRDVPLTRVDHGSWWVETRRARWGWWASCSRAAPTCSPTRPALRSGNTVVFRIGSGALGTARAIMRHAVGPRSLVPACPRARCS
ncbi:MAG: hypothetical protein R2713_05285 [Ilumatobacteraceae bacterium]